VTAVVACGHPDALFDAALARPVRVAPTAVYLAARAALRAGASSSTAIPPAAPAGPAGRPVETIPASSRRHRALRQGARAGRRRDRRLRSAAGQGWVWTDEQRVGNGPRAYGRSPTPLRIARAIPPGHRRATQAHRWLARVREAALAEFRADAAERRIALAVVAARHLDVATGVYAGGWDRLAHLVGVSRSTVARWLAWLRARSLLGVVSTGRVTDTDTPMALVVDGDGQPRNEAAVYVPCEPDTPRVRQAPDPGLVALDPRWATGQLVVGDDGRVQADRSRHPRTVDDPTPAPPAGGAGSPGSDRPVDETDTPVWTSGAGTQNGRAHAPGCTATRATAGGPLRGQNIAAPRQPQPGHPESAGPVDSPVGSPAEAGPCPTCGAWPAHQAARTRAERLRLAHQLRRTSPDLAPISARLLRHLLRPWLHAGWTATDLLHAIDHHPTTGPRRHSPTTGGPGTIRNPAGWLVARLRDWQTPDGTPGPSQRQRTAAARATGAYAPPPTTGPTVEAGPVIWPAVRPSASRADQFTRPGSYRDGHRR